MVGYCLGLSNACPVRYGLLFERFTDPDRSEYPDIDIDICQDGRQQVLDYVRHKYGHVAQIITFGTLKARAALRDVGRVLNVPLPEVDQVCKLVGDGLGTTISKAMEQEPDLRKLYQDNPLHKQMIDTAKRLEGLSRHAGVHAAGVVIATVPLDQIVPLYRPSGTDQVVTQWDGPTVEKMGLLKMDFLGLRTLSIVERARQLIREALPAQAIAAAVKRAGAAADPGADPGADPLDLERLAYDDQRVFDLFRRAETAGVFQFESGGMRNLLMGMKPDRLEDLIAANALFRPGPMDLIPDYNDRKHGRAAVPKAHPIIERYTAETYGIMVYQEQVMQIVHDLGGIPLRAAYTLIKNISKKKQKDIDAVRPTFVAGAQEKGMTGQQAQDLFELILKFAGYGFNKSHSTGYAILAYQTAYLKTFFPVPYMAAVLTYESVATEKVVEYVEECRHVLRPDGVRGIAVRPPDINLSDVGFNVVFDPGEPHDASHGHIRFGLSAVKGVGDKAIEAVRAARARAPGGRFTSLFDFCERVPLGAVNRATIEALVKCGAFDSLHGAEARAALVEALDAALAAGQRAASDRESGQMNFFGGAPETAAAAAPVAAPQIKLPTVPPWTVAEQLLHEKSVLGFFLSSHPLDPYRDTLARFGTATTADLEHLGNEVKVVVGGMLTRVRQTVVKHGRSAGQKMAMIAIEDAAGSVEGVIFSDGYAIAAPLLEPDRVVFLEGRVDHRRERAGLVVDKVHRVEDAPRLLTKAVRIILRGGAEAAGGGAGAATHLGNLKELLRQAAPNGGNGGGAAVVLEVHEGGQVVRLRVERLRVQVDLDLPERIASVLHLPSGSAAEVCQLVGPPRVAVPAGKAPTTAAPAAAPLRRAVGDTPEEEFCESIDRY
jgi:DNA polymerase-3 subunit alpha